MSLHDLTPDSAPYPAGSTAVPTHEDQRHARGGWAPGRYLCVCRHCHKRFTGDKRAVSCADCAYAADADAVVGVALKPEFIAVPEVDERLARETSATIAPSQAAQIRAELAAALKILGPVAPQHRGSMRAQARERVATALALLDGGDR